MLKRLKNRINPKKIVKTFRTRSEAQEQCFVQTTDGTPVAIVRSSRKKTLAVKVSAGNVSVHVPQRTTISHIEALIEKKSDWIQQKLLQQEGSTPPVKHEYVDGEQFLYLGEEKSLKIVIDVPKSIEMTPTSINVGSRSLPTSNNVKNRLKMWYQAEAQLYLAKRTRYFADKIGVKPRLVNTRSYRARWGCCSNRREITYNWMIIMAPPEIIDYVIVHELCHIKEHNHSIHFWRHVEAVMPDYKERKQWLDTHGYLIQF